MVLSVAVSPDGTLVASGAADNTARIWDFPSANALRSYAMTDAVNAVALSPDGDQARRRRQGRHGQDLERRRRQGAVLSAGHTGPVLGVAFAANGQLLVSSGADKTLRFWNPTNGQAVGVIGGRGGGRRP